MEVQGGIEAQGRIEAQGGIEARLKGKAETRRERRRP